MYGHAIHVTGDTIHTYLTEIHNYKQYIPNDAYELVYIYL